MMKRKHFKAAREMKYTVDRETKYKDDRTFTGNNAGKNTV